MSISYIGDIYAAYPQITVLAMLAITVLAVLAFSSEK
jgi:hypothetical protein